MSNPTLRRNDKGEWVEYLQLMLGRADYETGKIDGDFGPITERAVRQFETDHRLEPVDGVVDDAFWHSLEHSVGAQTGLRDPQEIDAYVEETIGVANSCTSAEDRKNAVAAAANHRLNDFGVPNVKFELDAAKSQGNLALFIFQDWTVYLDPARFEPDAADWATPEEQAALLGTVYHESRHAEQWFRIARYLAGRGVTPDQLAASPYFIPHIAGDAARLLPISPGSQEETEAAAWYESVYGTGKDHRRDTLKTGTFADKRALPEEEDAHDTRGLMVEEYLDEQSGDARPVLRMYHHDRDQIAYLQYYTHTIDGDFGQHTFDAVEAFQRDQGLHPVDGIVGHDTWTALDRARGF